MVFSSTTFLFLFFPLVILAYYIRGMGGHRNWKNFILLCASLGFYAWGEPFFVFIMIGTIIINWLLVLIMDKHKGRARKALCLVAVCIDVGLLFVFKYVSFLSRNLALLLKNDTIIINIVLPIGISFFTFQMISYVLDVYYKKSEPQKNPFVVMLYILFFPQLIAGPIVRYDTITSQLLDRKESIADFSAGIIRFSYGLGKKVLLANYLSITVDAIYGVDGRSVLSAWLGSICYTLQIYFDFSGYSDMAIGLGRIFGFHFLENFNYPYISASVTDFWRRWHMSLSSWFRDYVYIPLGGNQVGKNKLFRNVFIVWLLTGIWHGANWTFVVWGLLYFVIIMVEKQTGISTKKGFVSHLYTLLVVNFEWVVFRADSIAGAAKYLGSMIGIGSIGFIDDTFMYYFSKNIILLLVGVILSMPIKRLIESRLNEKVRPIWTVVTSALILCLSILSCVESTYQPFIYFNF